MALLENSTKKEDNSNIILVTTFNPYDDSVKDLVHKNWDLLGKSTNTSFLHEKHLLAAYRRPKNLRDILVRADCQIKKPKSANIGDNTPVASTSNTDVTGTPRHIPIRSNSLVNVLNRNKNLCSNKKCRYCPLLDKTGQITCTKSGQNFVCKKNISCKSSNLIYSITCNTCSKQYVGQTKRKLSERFQGHFYSIKSALEYFTCQKTGMQTNKREPKDAVGLHFSRADHNGTNDLKLQILDFMHLPPQSERGKTLRLKIEKAWIHRLRCTAPHGLNIFD